MSNQGNSNSDRQNRDDWIDQQYNRPHGRFENINSNRDKKLQYSFSKKKRFGNKPYGS